MNTKTLQIENTEIADTFAEGFTMRYTRLIITAIDRHWLEAALREFCGFGTSVIACNAEVGVERFLTPDETLDGREGASVLAFGFSAEALGKAMVDRVGQCLMTCPTTAVFNGLFEKENEPESEPQSKTESKTEPETEPKPQLKTFPLGKHLRFFGDGFQKSKLIGDRRFWRIPVMDGEFLVEESISVAKGVAGGNFLIQSANQADGLTAARLAVDAIAKQDGVITPFPGGVVRSGSKVGSRYKGLVASTSHEYCPMLRGRVDSKVHKDANCIYEIVIDGECFESVKSAIVTGVKAACGGSTIAIAAGNYGGKLGKHLFHLHELLEESDEA